MKLMRDGFWVLVVLVACLWTTTASAQQIWPVKAVGIHGKFLDADDNDLPDDGVTVSGRYRSFLAVDGDFNFYWDFGDGRIFTLPEDGMSLSDLDKTTLSVCDNQVIYRGEFNDDAVLDNGWVIEEEHCYGHNFPVPRISVYLIVHETDPRYGGDDPSLVFCTAGSCWEYQMAAVSGSGNILD